MQEIYPNDTIRSISELLFCETKPLRPSNLAIILGNNYTATMKDVKSLIDEGLITGEVLLNGRSATGKGISEAERFFQYGCELGIEPARMLLEKESTNTYENLLFCRRLIEKQPLGFDACEHILIVGKAFVLRRIEMTCRALGYPMEKVQYYGTVDKDGLNISPTGWWRSDKAAKRVFEELERIGKYAVKGDLSTL